MITIPDKGSYKYVLHLLSTLVLLDLIESKTENVALVTIVRRVAGL